MNLRTNICLIDVQLDSTNCFSKGNKIIFLQFFRLKRYNHIYENQRGHEGVHLWGALGTILSRMSWRILFECNLVYYLLVLLAHICVSLANAIVIIVIGKECYTIR